MFARFRFLPNLLLTAMSLGLSACDPGASTSDCRDAMGCSQVPEIDTIFHEWAGLDTLVLPGAIDPSDSVLAVVSIPAGCGYLDSVFQDRRGDTLVLRPRVHYKLYKDVSCAHGPLLDSLHLGPVGPLFHGVTKVAYLRSRRGAQDTTLVLPAPSLRRP